MPLPVKEIYVGSTFSGIGGLDCGLARVEGFRHVFFCEADPWRRSILAQHFPGVPVFDDVRSLCRDAGLSGEREREDLRHDERRSAPSGGEGDGSPAVDLLVGGFPCQDLSVAGKRAGFKGERSSLFCESDPWRREILAARFPGVPIYDDVCSFGESASGSSADRVRPPTDERRREAGTGLSVDLLVGGFPCQDLSVAGKRAGFKGERSSLFFEFARIADGLVRPGGYVLIENVPGLFSSAGGRDFAALLGTLADLGFHDLAWRVLDSRFFGVPQRRRRVFILARRSRGTRCAEILLEPESGGGDSPTRVQAREEVAEILGGGAGGHGNAGVATGQIVTHALTCHQVKGGDPTTDNYVTGFHLTQDPISEEGSTPALSKGNKRGCSTLGVAIPSLTASNDPSRSPQSSEITQQVSALSSAGYGVRRLTPTECERLQGLPDGWTLPGSDSKRYAGLGDAVTANVAEWIGRRLMERA